MIILGGYGEPAAYPPQEPHPPYPMYGTPGQPQTAYKPQAPYPTGTAYPPPQPQTGYYQGSPYQPTTAASVSQPYEQNAYHHDDEVGIVGDGSDWAGSSFSNKKIRHTFIKKVCRCCVFFARLWLDCSVGFCTVDDCLVVYVRGFPLSPVYTADATPVESCRRLQCVLNSQLAHDDCRQRRSHR